MSDLCLSSTPKITTRFSSLLVLQLFFTFILSHPLYFSCFIFFSPYLLKLLYFLSPLFITTSLLLVVFLTLSPGLLHENSPLKLSVSKVDDEDDQLDFDHFEVLEAYKIVFDTGTLYKIENSDAVLELRSEETCFQALQEPVRKSTSLSDSEVLVANSEEKTLEIFWEETTQALQEGKRLEGFLKELDQFENMTYNVEEKIELLSIKSSKVEENKKVRMGSDAIDDKIMDVTGNGRENALYVNGTTTDNGGEYTCQLLKSPNPNLRTLNSNILGSYGSMRKEKDWKRTLACKLFEERRNVDGGEGMDSLWETYEMDSMPKNNYSNKKKNKKKKSTSECYEDDGDHEEEGMDGQLCCLQALKLSTGKMNLGMGRPNLVKISKAIKGIGWLHQLTKHRKK